MILLSRGGAVKALRLRQLSPGPKPFRSLGTGVALRISRDTVASHASRRIVMTETGPWQSLVNEWPKLLATGVLLPILQWVATQLWQMRRKSRVIALRKEMNDAEDFISKHKDSPEPRVAEAVRVAQNDCLTLLAKLERASRPLSSQFPTSVVASIFLLYRPPSLISWLCRVVFFSAVATFVWTTYSVIRTPIFDLGKSFFPTIKFLGIIFLIPAFWYWLTRAADKVTGAPVPRPKWQRYSLLYLPVSLAAAFTQLFFWFYFVFIVVEGRNIVFRDHDSHVLFVFALTIFSWFLARHLDRKAIPATAS
jgi:hypothetical protein